MILLELVVFRLCYILFKNLISASKTKTSDRKRQKLPHNKSDSYNELSFKAKKENNKSVERGAKLTI